MNGIRHPFSGATYEQDGNGNVLVTSKGRTGLFRGNGSWIQGDIEEADPQMCGWIAGPIIVNHRIASSADAIAGAHGAGAHGVQS